MTSRSKRPGEPFEKQQFNVYLPPELVKRLKHHAIERGESLSKLVERVFRQYLTGQADKEGGRHG